MNWTIKQDCYVASHNGHRFELGEMRRGHWVLKHWDILKDEPQSDCYNMSSEQEGKALAERLAQ
jgi:hypothetical protein